METDKILKKVLNELTKVDELIWEVGCDLKNPRLNEALDKVIELRTDIKNYLRGE